MHSKPLSFSLALSCVAALSAQSPVQSTFAGGLVWTNTNPPPVTALFDVNVVDPTGIVVRQFDCNINTAAGTTATLGVYVTTVGGTLVGNEQNAAAWTQVGTATRTHTGGRTVFVLATPFYLATGSYGVALHHVGANAVYTNPVTAGLPSTYSTAEATLNMISARVRPSTLVDPFAAGAAGNLRHPNIAMHYVSGAVSADFSGTPTRGTSPLTVQFTSIATSGNPGGILAYSWDFDNDGLVDSVLPNPTHTYTTCGNYTVSFSILDSVGLTTVTKANYIQTDVVVPSFTNQLVAPNVVQFTDTSSPPAQTWAWDLDGDGQTDSTLQNPQWSYTSGCGEVNVRLTVTRACQPAVVLQKRVAVASSLETTFQSGLVIAATATGGANFMDVNVTNPLGVTICGLHINYNGTVGNLVTVNLWQKAGTYVGNVETAAPWRQVASGVGASLGAGQRTFIVLATPVHLPAGLHGIALEQIGSSPVYTNLGAAQTYSNADFSVTTGLVQQLPIFGPVATSPQFTPRVWNGAIHFATSQAGAASGYGYFAPGCAGTLGIPRNVAITPPVLGSAATLQVDRLPFDIGIMVVGLSRTVSGIGPLPVDLTFLGMPSCPLHVSFEATAAMVGAGNTATLPFPIPAAISLLGTQVYTQALSLDPLLNQFGFAISDAAVMLVGQ
jgi:PKD repeat protein